MTVFYGFGVDSAQTIWTGSLRSRWQIGRGLCHRSRLPLGDNVLFWALERVGMVLGPRRPVWNGEPSPSNWTCSSFSSVVCEELSSAACGVSEHLDWGSDWQKNIRIWMEIQWRWEAGYITKKVKKKKIFSCWNLVLICFWGYQHTSL